MPSLTSITVKPISLRDRKSPVAFIFLFIALNLEAPSFTVPPRLANLSAFSENKSPISLKLIPISAALFRIVVMLLPNDAPLALRFLNASVDSSI